MAVEFFLAKNSSESAKANGIALHSAYNPEIEAERFAQGLDASFVPACVIVLEAALGHCLPFLRKKFPGAKIGVIRFCEDFKSRDKEWDFALSLRKDASEKGASEPLSERLFLALGEEGLYKTLFYEWPPSARAWPEETRIAWQEIKAAAQKAKAVLATREHFGKRWLKNKIHFFERLQKTATLKKIKAPLVICASGPSLEEALPAIKAARKKIFLCALSSSATVLARFGLEPDLCMSCDGGWWAKKHLDIFRKRLLNCPLALATEAALPACLFKTKTIVPLCYDDDALSKELFDALGVGCLFARRNGTVSGSALELFKSLSDGPIFFAGLDMQASKTRGHARPNALQTESEAKDFRLFPKATRAARSALKNEALEIYASWFSSFPLKEERVFRIKGREPFKRRLGSIADISAEDFLKKLESQKNCESASFFTAANLSNEKDKKGAMRQVLEKWRGSKEFLAELFPADCIMAAREKDEQEKKRRLDAARKKSERLFQEIYKEGLD